MNNRLHNCTNPYQGKAKKVLCVCSAGLLRSPTAAEVLSREPFNFNTRAVGIDIGHALIPIDDVLITWADEIVVMDKYMSHILQQNKIKRPIINLNIGDIYDFRNPKLIKEIKESYENANNST